MFPLTIFLRRMWYNTLYIRCRTALKGEITVPLARLTARVGRNPRSGIFTASVRSPAACVLQEKRMKRRNILIGTLSAVCVMLIAVIALLCVRSVNISNSVSLKKEINESAGSREKDRTESSPKAGRSEGKGEADTGSTADGSGTDGIVKNGENRNGSGTAGNSPAEVSGTDSGEADSGEYEIDGVLYMSDGRPVYEYLDPPQDSVVDYCPFNVEEFVASVASVYQMAHDNGYEYGNSSTLPPCEDGFIACDRLIARALWDLGYTDQMQGGMQIVSGNLTEEEYLTTHGFIKINDQSKLMRGDIVLQDDGKDGGPRYTWHTFVLVDYDPATQMCSKYDCGHFTPEGIDRVSSEQPFTCPLADFGDQRRFVCAFRIRNGSAE